MSKKKKYIGSFANISVGKTATFGFREKKFKTLTEYANQCLRQASIPVTVKNGHRMYDAVTKIHGFLRFDCDVRGEKETILSVLDTHKLAYICLPSTNYNPNNKNYKFHITVPVENVAQDVYKYKWQVKQALIDLGIDLHDRRVTEVCTQNMNAYKNGKNPVEGMGYSKIVEGMSYRLKTAPKDLAYSEMTKTVYNGKGSGEVIPKKVVYATDKLEVLSPNSGIKIENVGWVQLKDINLDVGGMIGGLSCPSHNPRHNNGKGGHQTGYAFATMNEGGDVWVTCTGAECQGKSYKVDYPDYEANTKLSDLFELRKVVSLSGFNYDKGSIVNIKDDGSNVMFKWKEVFDFWDKEMFWKLPLDMTEENMTKLKKLNGKLAKAKKRMDVGKQQSIEDDINNLKLENEYNIIEVALGNKTQFDMFKAKYLPEVVSGVVTVFPHEKYIAQIAENIGKYIKTQKQFDTLTHKIDPFLLDTKGVIQNNEFVVTTNRLLPPPLSGTINKRVVEDYLEHNPYLEDIMNMIMAQRYGADKKSSYLWIKADSDWGKSFLFEGMMQGLGYGISESETKGALKGEASGLDVAKMIRSSFLFFDEFKGAVSELKNIATEMPISPKFKSKTVIPVYMKIFASAEEVHSLHGDIGMEAQFANRFLFIEAKGSLLERKLYVDDMDEYKRSVMLYVNKELWKLKGMYDGRGRYGATKLANKIYAELKVKYTIKTRAEDITEVLPRMFREWLTRVTEREGIKGTSYTYEDCIRFTKSSVHILNMAKAKEKFLSEHLDRTSANIARHKSYDDIMGNTQRSSVKIDGNKVNTYRVKGKVS